MLRSSPASRAAFGLRRLSTKAPNKLDVGSVIVAIAGQRLEQADASEDSLYALEEAFGNALQHVSSVPIHVVPPPPTCGTQS